MPYQNRVDPFGKTRAVSARGALMGNRGILHDSDKRVLRTHNHQNWIACTLAFRGRKRTIMGSGTYTELFFLDEATAYAAGHRPCGECRHQDYKEFTRYWRQVQGEPEPGRLLSKTIDRTLHAHRIARSRQKITFQATAEGLPDGTMFAAEDQAVLVWKGRQLGWSFTGYREHRTSVRGSVEVLTPRPIVELFSQGLEPSVHRTASDLAGSLASARSSLPIGAR